MPNSLKKVYRNKMPSTITLFTFHGIFSGVKIRQTPKNTCQIYGEEWLKYIVKSTIQMDSVLLTNFVILIGKMILMHVKWANFKKLSNIKFKDEVVFSLDVKSLPAKNSKDLKVVEISFFVS